MQRWQKENAEHLREYRKRRLEENPELVQEARAYAKAYYQDNKGKFSEYRARRVARTKGLRYEGFSVQDIVREYGSTCYLCGIEVDVALRRGRDDSPVIEHVFPLCVEGTPGHVLSNVRMCHAICNARKSSLMVEDLILPMDPPKGEPWNVLE